ncbi:retrovirus-related pol polyprotein from transposon tnt 1-94 [Lasius niger]|uniref:Retrovirus-related pol polyprotein from transposon tnt 1-94 n=1 Tax=Lasius niger TaxID=67767 RepID=A0A0J7KCP5_LASNI|nr:retrovirus-related pol polyprotein from transposon tnt 1-94 [Lasius niger]
MGPGDASLRVLTHKAEALLIKNDAWSYVCGEKRKPIVSADSATRAASLAAHDAWVIEDRKAKSDLILSINPSELKQVKGCETSKDVWDKLESIYASKGPEHKATLLKNLMLRKMREDGDVKDHLNDLFDAVDKLQSMNVEINGDMLAIIILYSLPDTYDTFRCATESRNDLPDAETLKIKIIEESEARKRKTSDHASNALFAKHQNQHASKNKAGKDNRDMSSTNKRIRCNYCKKNGHKATNCFAKRNSEQKAGHATETVLLTSVQDNSKEWCLDSGYFALVQRQGSLHQHYGCVQRIKACE